MNRIDEFPLEILQTIFEAIDDTPDLSQLITSTRITDKNDTYFGEKGGNASKPIPCLDSVSMVCKRWRSIVKETSTFRFGELIHISVLDALLHPTDVFRNVNIDINLDVSLRRDTKTDASNKWVEDRMLSLHDRLRELVVRVQTIENAMHLSQKLDQMNFPRLRTLIIRFPNFYRVKLPTPKIKAPKLQVINFRDLLWDLDEISYLFRGLSSVMITQPHRLPWKLSSLARCIGESSINLILLVLEFKSLEREPLAELENLSINLPRLRQLHIESTATRCIVRFLVHRVSKNYIYSQLQPVN